MAIYIIISLNHLKTLKEILLFCLIIYIDDQDKYEKNRRHD